MHPAISVSFSPPSHGWLPVKFRSGNFHLDIYASDVANDPVEELYNVVVKLKDKESREVTWWLEPAAYIFEFGKAAEVVTLTVIETPDLNRPSAPRKVLHTISGSSNELIEPFRKGLREFCSLTYEETDWPYKLDKDKIAKL